MVGAKFETIDAMHAGTLAELPQDGAPGTDGEAKTGLVLVFPGP